MKNKSWVVIIILILLLFAMATYHFITIEKTYGLYQEEHEQYIELVDSLNKENENYLHQNDSITLTISQLKYKLDSLENHKQILEEKINDFTVTYDVMEGVAILQQNLWNM